MSASEGADARRAVRSTTLAIGAGAAIVLLSIAVHLSIDAARNAAPWTNNDTALILFIARQMHAGARLYVDWQDSDLPSIFFVALTAVRAGRIGLSTILAYDFITIVVSVLGLLVLVRSLLSMKRPWPTVLLTAAAYLFFLLKPGQNARDFGQREHLFALLLIPELFALASPIRLPWRPLWCAALAFLAMIKPQFAAIVAILELTAPRHSRLQVADVVGFAAGALAPFGMLWWHSAESFSAFFTRTLVLHLSGAYALLNRSPAVLLSRGPMLTFGAALAALAVLASTALAARRNDTIRGLAVRSAVAIALGAAAVVHQQKYFPYHFTPLFGLAVVCGAWAAGEWLSAKRQALVACGAAAALLLAGLLTFHADVAANADPLPVRLARVIGPSASVLVLSVYSHGLCTPYRDAPRCVGPQTQQTKLPSMARAGDGAKQVRLWASGVAEQVRDKRPALLAISTADAAMPDGLTPARILLEQFPLAAPGQYLPLSPAADAYAQARGWTILRRSDVAERWPVSMTGGGLR